ncbi:hypothetical protein DMB66_47990 [Actinoplanes sp. ATCC 53533]|uniref:hypothetical protein n=1 Tax=Actinoplanes sp. ATCC 53533 TaxID=1288362 RepID=UPI000F7B290D|nr:hypothetical protein [Actinoplanes sp. ATCC 53533]RSM47496.1 hypothetical protein DMB66_47990 [Actinoplanes sp. ATCC 53533]
MAETPTRSSPGLLATLNGRHHRAALRAYLLIVVAHWAEHLVQAYQIWGLGMSRPAARGVLGQYFPWLITSEWLHYGFALLMLAGLVLLRPGFAGRARAWWTVSLILQFWHHVEHLLLFVQAQAGVTFFGAATPVSIAQLVMPRVELHLFYNSVVFLPMLVAMYYHLRPNAAEDAAVTCHCARRTPAPEPLVARV